MNFHNNHVWADENPNAILEGRHQHQFSLNVWVGIVGDHLIGPFFLPPRLTGDVYRRFLEDELPVLLEDIPLPLRLQMYFMHDGAPPHFSLAAREYLNNIYPNRWIGRGGTQPWPREVSRLKFVGFFPLGSPQTFGLYDSSANHRRIKKPHCRIL
uniref:Transposable element Tc3 transposase n=1 Tax=Anoplophora glabripennis TaxID=217634 RepID=V5GJV9_ANOGL